MKFKTYLLRSLFIVSFTGRAGLPVYAQTQSPEPAPVSRVNVFLGSSGDHGQLSPAASYPFGLLSIGPETYPNTHMGYDNKAKVFLGFTHNRMEGVGCRGSGGNMLIKPFTGDPASSLLKAKESGSPGYYAVSFLNGIAVRIAVDHNTGIEEYSFPEGANGFTIDLSHAFANGFIDECHSLEGSRIAGWIESGTTCRAGAYRVYYTLEADGVQWTDEGGHHLLGRLGAGLRKSVVRVAFSSVDTSYAVTGSRGVEEIKSSAARDWNIMLKAIGIKGNSVEGDLFYSLLYRTMQSPYIVSEKDGSYRGNDGGVKHGTDTVFNGWAIWDNYRTQLPLLALAYPEYYKNIAMSIASMYKYGKKNWATKHEPSNSVRTEHAIVVLLDAYRKGFPVDFRSIFDSLRKETDSLEFAHPDKALESGYDAWAMSEICGILGEESLKEKYRKKAAGYRSLWKKDFADLTKNDVDRMGARDMYQGNIWQYRWLVPYDIKGLIALCGGDSAYRAQLDAFFAGDYYNAANETDIQVPAMYNESSEPWKSQDVIHRYAVDTVIQLYSDMNLRGVDPLFGRVYNNRPEAFVRSMDDDAGAMSAWYVFAAIGLSQACVGHPVYYLNVPLFPSVTLRHWGFRIAVKNFGKDNRFIKAAWLNGKPLGRNWITQDEIKKGGELVIEASGTPNKTFGTKEQWVTEMK